jgi:hypothetical protein
MGRAVDLKRAAVRELDEFCDVATSSGGRRTASFVDLAETSGLVSLHLRDDGMLEVWVARLMPEFHPAWWAACRLRAVGSDVKNERPSSKDALVLSFRPAPR